MTIMLKGFHKVEDATWDTYVNTDSSDNTMTIVQEDSISDNWHVVVLELQDVSKILSVLERNLSVNGVDVGDSDGHYAFTVEGVVSIG